MLCILKEQVSSTATKLRKGQTLKLVMSDYNATVEYWDKVFEQEVPSIETRKPFPFPMIEKGLQWLCLDSQHLIDFGCGNGKVLLRCLALGVQKALGIDISTNAVSLANLTAHVNGLSERATFLTGSISNLRTVENNSVDAVILFNIVDNMIPRDVRTLLGEVKRIIKPEGRVLMKVNDCFHESKLNEDNEYEALGNGFYRETSGLFLWNLSNDDIKSLVGPELEVEQSAIVKFKQYNALNRLFFLRSQ